MSALPSKNFLNIFSWMEIDARQNQADQHPSNLQKQVLSQVRADMGASQNAGSLKGPRSPGGLGFRVFYDGYPDGCSLLRNLPFQR